MLKPIRIGLILPKDIPDPVVNKLKRNLKKRTQASIPAEVLGERPVRVGHKIECSISIPRDLQLSPEQIRKLVADLHNEILSTLQQVKYDDTIVTEDWTIVDNGEEKSSE